MGSKENRLKRRLKERREAGKKQDAATRRFQGAATPAPGNISREAVEGQIKKSQRPPRRRQYH